MFNISTLHRGIRSTQSDSSSVTETAKVCGCPSVRAEAAQDKKIERKAVLTKKKSGI
jgi:hypothetical protein